MAKKGCLNHFNAELFKQLLKDNSFTVPAFSDRIGMHNSVVYNWMAGRGKPRADAIKQIAKALKVAPAQLSDDYGNGAPRANGHSPMPYTDARDAVQLARLTISKRLFDDTTDPEVAQKLARATAHLNAAMGELK